MMQRAHLLIAGAAACGLLAFNPAFVTRWVGAPMFDGLTLNALLAIGLVIHSFVHGLITSASIAGNRPRVGAIVLANGALHLLLAVFLGHRFGLVGVAIAGLVGSMLTQLPGSIVLLRRTTDLRMSALVDDLVAPWFARALPLLLMSAFVGVFHQTIGIWLSAVASGVLCLAYVWHLRPFYAEGLPLDPRWTEWMRYFRLLPAPAPVFEEVEAGR
jgi:hypothetical protein